MLTSCFPNIYLGHIESSTPVVTDSSSDVRGEGVPNCDEEVLMPRLAMLFDKVEDYLEL